MITKGRIIGLIIKGPARTDRWTVRAPDRWPWFSIDHDQVQQVTVQPNWRGKVTSLDFTGSASGSFALSVMDVLGVIRPDATSGPSTFDKLQELYSTLTGRQIPSSGR